MPSSFGQWLVVILALLVGLVVGWVVSGRRTTAGPATTTVEGEPAVAATIDRERPEAVVDEVPAPAAVTEEPSVTDADATPAAATLAAEATPPSAERPDTAPAEVAAADVAEPAGTDAEPATTEPAATATPAAAAPVAAEESAGPAVVPAPRSAVEDAVPAAAETATDAPADDFRRIQGVGPKMAAALQAAGVRTYQQLAELDEAALRETIRAAGLRAAPSLTTWSQQAKVLAGARADAEQVLPAGTGEQA